VAAQQVSKQLLLEMELLVLAARVVKEILHLLLLRWVHHRLHP